MRFLTMANVDNLKKDYAERTFFNYLTVFGIFLGKENQLSFNEHKTMVNNNYLPPKIRLISSAIEDCYQFNESKIF